MNTDDLRDAIRDVPDFPKEGILFKDIAPLLADPLLLRKTMDLLAVRLKGKQITKVAGIDARGFVFGGILADRIGAGFIPIRKAGKLPSKTYEETYDLEYGTATLAIHQDAFEPGEKVVLIDDLLATGGTAAAAAKLVEKAGGEIVEIDFVIELTFLNGREKLQGRDLFCLLEY